MHFFHRYGDRAPISFAGRFLALFVILSGLVIFGLVNGIMATAITTVVLETDYKIYGSKVSSSPLTGLYLFVSCVRGEAASCEPASEVSWGRGQLTIVVLSFTIPTPPPSALGFIDTFPAFCEDLQ